MGDLYLVAELFISEKEHSLTFSIGNFTYKYY